VKHYKEKVIITSYLESVQGDLETRLEAYNNKHLTLEETLQDRINTVKDSIKKILIAKNFLHELWDDYSKLLQEDIKRRTI